MAAACSGSYCAPRPVKDGERGDKLKPEKEEDAVRAPKGDGPAPPRGHGVHHYHFRLYALDQPLEVEEKLDNKALIAGQRPTKPYTRQSRTPSTHNDARRAETTTHENTAAAAAAGNSVNGETAAAAGTGQISEW